jgi:hypothetical protein
MSATKLTGIASVSPGRRRAPSQRRRGDRRCGPEHDRAVRLGSGVWEERRSSGMVQDRGRDLLRPLFWREMPEFWQDGDDGVRDHLGKLGQ